MLIAHPQTDPYVLQRPMCVTVYHLTNVCLPQASTAGVLTRLPTLPTRLL